MKGNRVGRTKEGCLFAWLWTGGQALVCIYHWSSVACRTGLVATAGPGRGRGGIRREKSGPGQTLSSHRAKFGEYSPNQTANSACGRLRARQQPTILLRPLTTRTTSFPVMAFNLSALRCSLPAASSSSARSFTTTSITKSTYPFSSTATIIPASPTPPPKTTSLLRTVNLHLNSQTPNGVLHSTLFSRRHPDRLLPGSVVTISTYSTPPTPANPAPSSSSFSGVLIALRRRHAGRDTSVRLRNLVGRTGVEVSYKISSPMIKEIKVVSRAATSGAPVVDKQGRESRRKPALRAEKRAKLYFVRDQPDRELKLVAPKTQTITVLLTCHLCWAAQAWPESEELSSRPASASWWPRLRLSVAAGRPPRCNSVHSTCHMYWGLHTRRGRQRVSSRARWV